MVLGRSLKVQLGPNHWDKSETGDRALFRGLVSEDTKHGPMMSVFKWTAEGLDPLWHMMEVQLVLTALDSASRPR